MRSPPPKPKAPGARELAAEGAREAGAESNEAVEKPRFARVRMRKSEVATARSGGLRYYRCRGSAERPACRPSVQVSASQVEVMVLHLLQHPDRIAGASPVARQVLDALVPVWPTLTRGETNEVVRLLV